MLGIRDLARHLLFVAKEKQIDEQKLYKTTFEKIVFLAFVYCIKEGIKIRYDVLFEKSTCGASSKVLKYKTLGCLYDRHVSFDNAKEIKELSLHKEFNKYFGLIIEKEAEETFHVIEYIVKSNVFQRTKTKQDFKFWTLAEIYEFAGKEPTENDDLRIPLNKKEFRAIQKYIRLLNKSDLSENETERFTIEDIYILQKTPHSIIEAVIEHGAYEVGSTYKL